MCGISGIISTEKFNPNDLVQMNNKMSHRGPDSDGYLFSSNLYIDELSCNFKTISSDYFLGFAHKRLSIVDLSPSGHQPMSFQNRYWIVYNGEIYNHIEIKNELINFGYDFKSTNDTEVILASYDHWGVECFNKFNGMWAIVIFDSLNSEIIISKDRFGIKPLYFYKDDTKFIFASEIKSIISFTKFDKKLNEKFLIQYLEHGSEEFTNETAFKNIFRFDNASYVKINIQDIFKPFRYTKYWDVKPNLSDEKFSKSLAEYYANEYYELLKDAVRIRLRADVKVGSASSGGLDSSSIVYLINQILSETNNQEKQVTFSTVYKSPGTEKCDESNFIDEITSALNVISYKIEPNVFEIPSEHEKLIYALENPPDNTLMSSWHTFKLVNSSDVTVTLDGQGADEQLAGYLPYIIIYFANLNLLEIFKSFFSFYKTNTIKYALIGVILNFSKRLIGKKITSSIYSKLLGKETNVFINLNQRLDNDFKTHLVTLLHYADHTSMAHSIESRMPFMDYRLVEFLLKLPASYKIHDGWTKYIARLAFDSKLPNSITWRKDKMGWPIPEKEWFSGNLKDWYTSNLKNGEIFSNKELKYKANNTVKLKYPIRIINLSIFKKVFFNEL